MMKGLGELTSGGVGRPLSSGQNHDLVVSFAGVSCSIYTMIANHEMAAFTQ